MRELFAELKSVTEAEEIFKPATPAELKKRKEALGPKKQFRFTYSYYVTIDGYDEEDATMVFDSLNLDPSFPRYAGAESVVNWGFRDVDDVEQVDDQGHEI